MKRYDAQNWQVECARRSKNGTLRDLMQSLARGEIEVIDAAGQALNLSPSPDRATVAALPLVPVKDRFGRIIAEAAPAEVEEPRGEVDMDRFRSQMRLAESFSEDDKKKAIKAIYREHLGIEI